MWSTIKRATWKKSVLKTGSLSGTRFRNGAKSLPRFILHAALYWLPSDDGPTGNLTRFQSLFISWKMAVHWETQRCIFKEFLLLSSHLQSPGNAGEVITMVSTYWGLDAGCSGAGTVLSILTPDITLIPHSSLDVATFYRWGHRSAKVRYLAQGYTAGRRQNQDVNPALQTLNQNYYTASYHPCPVKLFS